MLVAYNDKSDIYRVDLMFPETEIYIKAEDIVQARERFIEHMTWLFDEAVRKRLNDSF